MDIIKLITKIEIICEILSNLLLKVFSALALTKKITYKIYNLNTSIINSIKSINSLNNDTTFGKKFYFEVV